MNYTIQQIPIEGLKGRVYRGTMPFGLRREEGAKQCRALLEENKIDSIVLLVTEDDLRMVRGDLKKFYKDCGIELIHFPIEDFGAPVAKRDFSSLVHSIHALLEADKHVLIHCIAGKGRTGLLICCLVKEYLYFEKGEQVIEWMRSHVPGAVETEVQQAFVREYYEKGIC